MAEVETSAGPRHSGQGRRSRRSTSRWARWIVLGVVVAGVLSCAAVAASWWSGSADRRYLAALQADGLSKSFPSNDAAVVHAKAVCAALDAGGKSEGRRIDLVAVQAYCPSYADGFKVSNP